MSLEPFILKYIKIPVFGILVSHCVDRYLPHVTSHTALPDIIPTKLYKLTENGDYLHAQIIYGFVLCDLKRRITRDKILCTCFCIQPYQNTCTNQTTLEWGFSDLLFLPARQETVCSKLATNNPFHMVEKRNATSSRPWWEAAAFRTGEGDWTAGIVLCLQLCWELGLWARHFSAYKLLQDLQIERATENVANVDWQFECPAWPVREQSSPCISWSVVRWWLPQLCATG